MAIRVEVHFLDLTAEEDVALLKALDLEGSPPAGDGSAWLDRWAAVGGSRVFGTAKQTTSDFVTTGSCSRSGALVTRCR